MRIACVLVAVVLACLCSAGSAFLWNPRVGDANGGSDCAACTIIVSLLEQRASIKNQSIDATVAEICDLFPKGVVQTACKAIVEEYGPGVYHFIEQ